MPDLRTLLFTGSRRLYFCCFVIAYLDQLQYSDAVQTFGGVFKLMPDYPDGYIDVVLAQIQWEKYK